MMISRRAFLAGLASSVSVAVLIGATRGPVSILPDTGGNYVAIVHPSLCHDLMTFGWRATHTGMIGQFEGVRFVETTRV